jgi:hypothetical protein
MTRKTVKNVCMYSGHRQEVDKSKWKLNTRTIWTLTAEPQK